MSERLGGVPAGYVQQVPNSPVGGEDALAVLLDLPEPPTAIMTSTDTLAVGVLHAAYAGGRRVPADLSVVGFDDIQLAGHTVPALTTLRMPTRDIVARGVQLAIDLSRDADASREPRVEVVAAELIVRESTAPTS
jgi:DNA-binding LacI/PurR family transcriptional regulator